MNNLAVVSNTEITIDDLAQDWKSAKRAEDAARGERLMIESAIAARLPTESGEGTCSIKTDFFKIAVSYGFNRRVDDEALNKAWTALKDNQRAAFKWKPEVSITNLRKLDGQDYNEISLFITATPAKPSVKVEGL